MIQGGILFPQGSGPDAGVFRLMDDLLPQFHVIFRRQPGLSCTEGGHIAGHALAGGDVEVIGVHDQVGRGDDQHLRLPCCGLFGSGAVCVDGGLDFPFLATPYSGDDDRRVGDEDGSYDGHKNPSVLRPSRRKIQASGTAD